jgi:hypothetical protein
MVRISGARNTLEALRDALRRLGLRVSPEFQDDARCVGPFIRLGNVQSVATGSGVLPERCTDKARVRKAARRRLTTYSKDELLRELFGSAVGEVGYAHVPHDEIVTNPDNVPDSWAYGYALWQAALVVWSDFGRVWRAVDEWEDPERWQSGQDKLLAWLVGESNRMVDYDGALEFKPEGRAAPVKPERVPEAKGKRQQRVQTERDMVERRADARNRGLPPIPSGTTKEGNRRYSLPALALFPDWCADGAGI